MNHSVFPRALKGRFCLALFITGLMLAAALLPPPAAAQGSNRNGPVLIRDTEIETIIRDWAAPVIKAADLDPDGVNIILISDDALNAFVAGGPNIFLFTGLLNATDSAEEVVGVIAHELGHIRGGHLIRTQGALNTASYESIVGTLLGIGAAVLTGEGGLGAAISAGARSTAMGKFLAYSRVQESSADQAALGYLERAGLSPRGLVSFMEKLENQELLPASQQSEYVRTHPLTSNRVEALNAGLARARHKDTPPPAAWADQHARLKAKINGFLKPEQVDWQYDSRDQSMPARYARAIATYRQNRVDEALRLADTLIRDEPRNPYFHELKGQMLVDFSRVAQAVPYYERAVALNPKAPLIRASYGHALIESAGNDKAQLEKAVAALRHAAREEPRVPRTHRLLATAHGRMGQESLAQLHLAEEALLRRELSQAKRLAGLAEAGLDEGGPHWIRAQDIKNAVAQAESNR